MGIHEGPAGRALVYERSCLLHHGPVVAGNTDGRVEIRAHLRLAVRTERLARAYVHTPGARRVAVEHDKGCKHGRLLEAQYLGELPLVKVRAQEDRRQRSCLGLRRDLVERGGGSSARRAGSRRSGHRVGRACTGLGFRRVGSTFPACNMG